MKQAIGTIPLFGLESGKFHDAVLFQGVDLATLQGIEASWTPMFDTAAAENRPEDAHWEWAAKALQALQNPLNYEIFGIEADGKTQGMMLVVKGGAKCFSRHPEHPRMPLVYVDFLATAPWNRRGLIESPTYKGVGRVLFMSAVSLSIEEEFAGRVALHSLPGAEAFYRDRLSMTDLGADGDYQNLRYFELSTTQARQLISAWP
ncbi:hypothetical protein [Limimaricola cinnabarinus]|uniref:hypothetical protein n=1 Tax=Limimaricola cinnabarinus TaxID=1125964 RepID=UPI0005EC3B3F|nr:hypothetical protein [Limimaricola cinnabarinus]